MTKEEAIEWIKGNRSMTNIIPKDPFETWQVRVAQADAACVQEAYWVLKAHNERLLEEETDYSFSGRNRHQPED